MTKKLIRDYLTGLRRRRDNAIGKVSNDTQAKINNVVDLYEDRKITQIATANNLIDGLTAKGKQREKGMKAYEKAIAKHQDKERVSEKQTKALEKGKRDKDDQGEIKESNR